ncbi:MAG: hypothetical protein Q9170_007165 [Blastenia crenularia]
MPATLRELESILRKRDSLGERIKKPLDRFKWDEERVESVRVRLVTSTNLLTAFNLSLLRASQARIEKLLIRLVPPNRRVSLESLTGPHPSSGFHGKNQELWTAIGHEMEVLGITPKMVHEALNEESSPQQALEPNSAPIGRVSQHQTPKHTESLSETHTLSDTESINSTKTLLGLRRAPAIKRPSTSRRSVHFHLPHTSNESKRTSMFESVSEAERRIAATDPNLFKRMQKRQQRAQSQIFDYGDRPASEVSDSLSSDDTLRPRHTFTDPPRSMYRRCLVGRTGRRRYHEHALEYGLDTVIDQLQTYLTGICSPHNAPHGHIPASYVIFVPNRDEGPLPVVARYRCQHPGCGSKWRDKAEHKLHLFEHSKAHFVCQVPMCLHQEGFASNVDLIGHLESDHGHNISGPFRGYACAADVCAKKDKVWLQKAAFRRHCEESHTDEDSEDQTERSRLALSYLGERHGTNGTNLGMEEAMRLLTGHGREELEGF